ncbi:TetR/AcrR family transcriptional regulator [Streptomyces sp. NPDC127177]|uniref:TetR/AcrR family transcriptional regulator n=1 Tax=Streptomyces sp. NPDC127177 TaxID=3345384 RepID=UPI0036281BB6
MTTDTDRGAPVTTGASPQRAGTPPAADAPPGQDSALHTADATPGQSNPHLTADTTPGQNTARLTTDTTPGQNTARLTTDTTPGQNTAHLTTDTTPGQNTAHLTTDTTPGQNTAHLTTDTAPPRRAHRPRNRRGEGNHLRAEIVAAATDLLDRGDERDVTLRSVARRAGITAPSIYPHFTGRTAILLAVVREAFADLAGRLGAAADAAGGDAAQRLHAACHAYLDFAAAHPERYRAMFGERANPVAVTDGGDAGDDLASLGADALKVLTLGLTDCVAAGHSTSNDPCADAIALWLGLHGLAHQRAISRAFPWPAGLVRPFVASLSHLDTAAGGPPPTPG